MQAPDAVKSSKSTLHERLLSVAILVQFSKVYTSLSLQHPANTNHYVTVVVLKCDELTRVMLSGTTSAIQMVSICGDS